MFAASPTQLGPYTQMLGTVSFLLAAAATVRNAGAPWRAVSGVLLLLALDVAVGASWKLHGAIDAVLTRGGVYGDHVAIQVAMLAAAAMLAVLGASFVFSRFDGVARLAVLGLLALLALRAVELTSLHGMDAVLFRAAGPVKLIAWLWAACALWIGAPARRCASAARAG